MYTKLTIFGVDHRPGDKSCCTVKPCVCGGMIHREIIGRLTGVTYDLRMCDCCGVNYEDTHGVNRVLAGVA